MTLGHYDIIATYKSQAQWLAPSRSAVNAVAKIYFALRFRAFDLQDFCPLKTIEQDAVEAPSVFKLLKDLV